MAKPQERLKARDLRRKGWSIKDISREVKAAKGSVSVWCRDIRLTEEQQNLLIKNGVEKNRFGRYLGAEANRQKKIKTIQESQEWARNKLSDLSDRDLFMAGVALYWAEGSKKNSSGLMIINSDPQMIMLMYTWMQKFFGVKKEDFQPRLAINEIHRPRIQTVLKFWSELLDIPIENFGNPWYVKTKQRKIYENHDNYYGVLRLGVAKSGNLKYKMISLIDIMSEHYKCRGSSVG